MKKVLTLAAALLVFGVSASMAQGLNLYWNNCGFSGVGLVNQNFNCAINSNAQYIAYASVFVPAPLPMFAATTALVDIGINDTSIPTYWQTLAGQCRANAVSMDFNAANNVSDCGDIWGGGSNFAVFEVQPGVNGPNRIRLNGGAALAAGSERVVNPGTELVVCRVIISRQNTLTCPTGCTTPGTMTLNECLISQPGHPDTKVTNPAQNACIGFNGGNAGCPGATPAQNTTWGAVKNLYR